MALQPGSADTGLDGIARTAWYALDQPNLGKAIRELRRVAGDITRDAFADLLYGLLPNTNLPGTDPATIYRWERAQTRNITHENRQLLALACQKVVNDLDGTTRRAFLMQLSALAGIPVLAAGGALTNPEPWERLSHALRHPSQADAIDVDHLEQTTITLLGYYQTQRASAVLGSAKGHLETITELLGGPLQPSLRQRLCSLAGESAALMGWLHWNLDDQRGAAQYFRAGLDAAVEAGDRALGAYLVGCLACKPFSVENPNERLRTLDSRPFGISPADATPATQAWLANLEAGGWALLENPGQFAAASDRAAELLQQRDTSEGDRRPRTVMFDEPYFAEEQAACLLRLQRPETARDVIERALPRSAGRIQLWLLVDKASAEARAGEPRMAVETAERALAGAWEAGVQPIITCVYDLLDDLEPHRRLAPVQELAHRLSTINRTF